MRAAPPPAERVAEVQSAADPAAQHREDSHRAWAPPSWLADGSAAGAPDAPSPGTTATGTPVIAAAAPTMVTPSQAVAAAPPRHEPPPTLDEVALRMERIKASAAAIRQAIEVEAQRAAAGPAAAPALQMASPAAVPARRAPARVAEDEDDFSDVAQAVVPPVADVHTIPRSSSVSGAFDAPHVPPPAANDLERSFLGDDDFDESTDDFNEGSMGDGAAFAAAPRPIPWRPILIAAGVLVVAGAWLFRSQIFPASPTPPTDDASVAAEVRPGSVAPAGKSSSDPQAGKAVTPEPAKQPSTDAGATPAGTQAGATPAGTQAGATPTGTQAGATPASTQAGTGTGTGTGVAGAEPTPRAAPDAETSARLDEARSLYSAAKGGTRKKKLDEARTLLQEILVTAPSQADALLLLAQIQLEQGKPDAALTSATQCVQVAAELADCWLTIGVLQQDRNKKADARTAYEKYVALAPDGRYAGDVRKQLSRLK